MRGGSGQGVGVGILHTQCAPWPPPSHCPSPHPLGRGGAAGSFPTSVGARHRAAHGDARCPAQLLSGSARPARQPRRPQRAPPPKPLGAGVSGSHLPNGAECLDSSCRLMPAKPLAFPFWLCVWPPKGALPSHPQFPSSLSGVTFGRRGPGPARQNLVCCQPAFPAAGGGLTLAQLG